MQTIEILNVIELNLDGGAIDSVKSFIIPANSTEDQKQKIVEQAEEDYRAKAVAHGASKDKELFEDEIGYDHYANDKYMVQLVWSE